jgi:hypothetical protein
MRACLVCVTANQTTVTLFTTLRVIALIGAWQPTLCPRPFVVLVAGQVLEKSNGERELQLQTIMSFIWV